MNRYFVDKELYDNTEANFNDLTIRYEHLEKVADERMSTILDIEKYCIDEKEDLISGCEVCEDILKMIDKLKGKKYYIKKAYTKRQIDKLKKKYENAVADYENTMFEKEQLNSLVNSCQEEIRQLKKQVEEKENIACNWKDSCLENAGKIEILETQQKEFIDYLESEIDRLARECSQIYEDSLGKTRLVNKDIFNEVDKILSKYKEIIGV